MISLWSNKQFPLHPKLFLAKGTFFWGDIYLQHLQIYEIGLKHWYKLTRSNYMSANWYETRKMILLISPHSYTLHNFNISSRENSPISIKFENCNFQIFRICRQIVTMRIVQNGRQNVILIVIERLLLFWGRKEFKPFHLHTH